MEYFEDWRSSLPESFRIFGSLLEQDKSISIAYGIIAGALLWSVRNDALSAHLSEALTIACGTPDVQSILEMVNLLQRSDVLPSAKTLTLEARDNEIFRCQLNRLLEYFRDDWLKYELLRPVTPSINISGSVEGANIVIGGVQYVAGDLVISQMVVQQKIRSCPTAPSPPQHFAGRRHELEHIKSALGQGKSVAISGIQGLGGIGKTALALQLAAETREFGGVLWASLGPEPAVLNHLLNWARHADPDFEPGEGPIDVLASRVQAMLTDLIRERCPGRVLVILDDVWEGDSVRAARLLQKAVPADSVSLITTRSQLVVAQLRSTRLELTPMSPEDALQMLRNLLSNYSTLADESLLELAAVVGHHPLAMELAAGQITLLERPENEIGELIKQYKRGLPVGSPFRDIRLELGQTREDNLEIVLSFSYANLDEIDQLRFRELGILAYGSPFDQSICRAVWLADPKPNLDNLRHRALLNIADVPGWYQQHPLLRAYARALLNQRQQESSQAAERYSEYIVDVTSQFNTLPLGDWNRLEPYVPHFEEIGSSLIVSTQRELNNQKTDGKILQRALSFALNTSQLLSNRREIRHVDWLEMGLSISRNRMDLGYVVYFLDEIGRDSYFRHDIPNALQKWHEALKTAEKTGDRLSMARTSTSLGRFYLSRDSGMAYKFLRSAIELYEQLCDPIGSVEALTYLAEYYSSLEYEKRAKGISILIHALDIAQSSDYERGIAEVMLKLGRLYDTLGNRNDALVFLTEAAVEYERLGRRDGEGTAHLFLASALANLKRFDECQSHLEKALALFRAIGDRVGLSVVLRNLAQLYAFKRQVGDAMANYVEALPLVHKFTGFLFGDSTEPSIAHSFFFASLESVVELELTEQFRRRGVANKTNRLENGNNYKHEELEHGGQDISAPIQDDLLSFLITETVRCKSIEPGALSSWSAALQAFITCTSGYGDRYQAEVQFAKALFNITVDQAPDIPEESYYASYVPPLLARIGHKQNFSSQPLLSPEELEKEINNTLATRIFQTERKREWSIQLRKQRRNADLWGDENESEFYAAQLAVLNGRVTCLSLHNPYSQYFEGLLNKLSQYERVPRDFVLEQTVAVMTVVPERASDWLEYLELAKHQAVRWGEEKEVDFLLALTDLINGDPLRLANDNPYLSYLEHAKAAIASGRPLVQLLPSSTLDLFMQAVLKAKTTEPKIIDVVAGELFYERDLGQRLGRVKDVALFDSLLALLFDRIPDLPVGNPYEPVLNGILEELRKVDRIEYQGPSTQATIPQTQVDNMIGMVTAALTDKGDATSDVQNRLQAYRESLENRNADWENERVFTDALLALLNGQDFKPKLTPTNPYQRFLDEMLENIRQHENIRGKGGKFAPNQLKSLLNQTATLSQAPEKLLSDQSGELKDFSQLFSDTQYYDAVTEKVEWSTNLTEMRARLAPERGEWEHEIELLDALVAVANTQPASVSTESPYYEAFRRMLKDMNYQPGIPDNLQTVALDTTGEEFREYFAGLFSGKNFFLDRLDIFIMNTVSAKTILPEKKKSWVGSLEENYRILFEQSENTQARSIKNELEFIRALQSVLRDESPTLPDNHPYYLHLYQVIESIRVFHGLMPSPYVLSGEQITRFYLMTPGTMTIAKEYFAQWKEELEQMRQDFRKNAVEWKNVIAFIDALLIILEDRPADLPLGNPYRPYLQLIQMQIKQMFNE
jgi:tetratricopeptide (TPR) repeat protein